MHRHDFITLHHNAFQHLTELLLLNVEATYDQKPFADGDRDHPQGSECLIVSPRLTVVMLLSLFLYGSLPHPLSHPPTHPHPPSLNVRRALWFLTLC